jgi:hypothetical protein
MMEYSDASSPIAEQTPTRSRSMAGATCCGGPPRPGRRHGEPATADLLERIAAVEVPPQLLRDILLGAGDPPPGPPVPSVTKPSGSAAARRVAGPTTDRPRADGREPPGPTRKEERERPGLTLEDGRERPGLTLEDGRERPYAADVILAAHVRLRALAGVLQDLFLGESADSDVILLHDNVFVAAACEPLIAASNNDIAFDPEGWRRRLLRLADGTSR